MSGYIGTQPVPQATQTRDSFTATSGQTSFATGGYTPNFLDVYLNGVKLAAADYIATNGSDVVLASGAATGDILEVVAFTTFTPADLPAGTPSIDDNGNAVALTIDINENVLVGQTTNALADTGHILDSSGTAYHIRDGASPLILNRKSSDGSIAEFYKDGTTVGSIGVGDNDNLYISGHAGSTKGLYFNDNTVGPVTNGYTFSDNTTNLGSPTVRFKDAYLSGGVNIYNSSTDAVDIRGTGSRCEIDNPDNNSILLKTGGTTRVRIDSNGLLFGSDTASANALDDYEEGTWTPILGGSTGTSGQSYSTQHGSYTKIGRVVHLQAYVVMASIGTSTGAYGQVQNLPFTAAPVQGYGGGIFQYFNLIGGTSVSQLIAYPEGNTTFAYVLYTAGSGTTTSYLGSSGWGTPTIMLSMTYLTNA